jgi:hypothetical protein
MLWKYNYGKSFLPLLPLLLALCVLLAGCSPGGTADTAASGAGDTASSGASIDSDAFGTISSEIPADDAVNADGKTTILYFGDVQPEASISEYEFVGALIADARAAYPEADFALQCGDITNTGSAPEEWNAFFAAAAPALDGLPLFLAPGNHESVPNKDGSGGKPQTYLEAFDLPENGPEGYEKEYYSINCGDVHLISLNANYLNPKEAYSADDDESAEIAARVDAWIEADLMAADRPWKIVLMHQPAYPLVGDSTAAAMRERWIPIFDRTGVDLVLCGHQHEFTRTFPLKGGEDDPDGLVQLMANSSQKFYEPAQIPLPEIAFEKGEMYGYYVITAAPGTLSSEAVDSDGRTVDYWEKTR